MIKRSLVDYRTDGSATIEEEHLDHCVEYLRQVLYSQRMHAIANS